MKTAAAPEQTRHRRSGRRWAVGVGLGAVVLFVLVWFQPQQLFTDETVNEAIPGATVVIWCRRFESAFGAADLQPR